MYAMYDGRKRCQPATSTPIIRIVKATSERLIRDVLRAGAVCEDLAEGVDHADPRRREVAVPVNLDVREVERIGAQHPEIGHVERESERNEESGERD